MIFVSYYAFAVYYGRHVNVENAHMREGIILKKTQNIIILTFTYVLYAAWLRMSVVVYPYDLSHVLFTQTQINKYLLVSFIDFIDKFVLRWS